MAKGKAARPLEQRRLDPKVLKKTSFMFFSCSTFHVDEKNFFRRLEEGLSES
jgi:hypothetical protein